MHPRILYVEDNLSNMHLVQKVLKHIGCEMVGVRTGYEGISQAKTYQFDVILVDVNLPDINGLVIVRKLKNDPHLFNTPMIALTANCMHDNREYCLAVGCDEYLAKPTTMIELKNTIKKVKSESWSDNENSERNHAYHLSLEPVMNFQLLRLQSVIKVYKGLYDQ